MGAINYAAPVLTLGYIKHRHCTWEVNAAIPLHQRDKVRLKVVPYQQEWNSKLLSTEPAARQDLAHLLCATTTNTLLKVWTSIWAVEAQCLSSPSYGKANTSVFFHLESLEC